jgi:hypothetical protein
MKPDGPQLPPRVDPNDLNEVHKDIYARYGLAMFMAQFLEHGIVNILFAWKVASDRPNVRNQTEWEEWNDSFFEREFQKTLGNILKSFHSAQSLSDEISGLLNRSKKERDFLAHHFFREYSDHFMNPDGRRQMMDRLDAAILLFNEADEAVGRLSEAAWQSIGLSVEMADEFYTAYVDAAERGESALREFLESRRRLAENRWQR